MKKKVLVFPCGSEIGLEINRALRYNKHFELWGASSSDNHHGKFVYQNYIEKNLPFVHEDCFRKELNDIIIDFDYIYPANDDVLLELSRPWSDYFNDKVIASPFRTCEICRSKKATYEYFDGILNVPEIYENPLSFQDLPFPLFIKPDRGQGSEGTLKAERFSDIAHSFSNRCDLLLMEYLPGDEYTIDCFTDRHGKLRFVGPRKRTRIKAGISVNAVLESPEYFEDYAHLINENLEMRGAWFFQMKYSRQNVPVLMEIAPRIAGTMATYRSLGINLPALTLYDRMGLDVEILNNGFDLQLDRAFYNSFKLDISYSRVYIDLDDCIIIDNKVNPLLMAFIYQCYNTGKQVNILTKHIGEIEQFLVDHNLHQLVKDTVFPVGTEICKSDYIVGNNSIFIDDSFKERQEVHRKCKIPVFDLDAVESLIDWGKM